MTTDAHPAPASASTPAAARTGPWKPRALAVAAAGLSTALIWIIANAGGAALAVLPSDGGDPLTITWPRSIALGALGAALGWGLLAILERRTARALRIWTIVALSVLAASFLPLVFLDASGGTKATLALMHTAVAAVAIPLFHRGTRD
ncbi:hypothetical protein SUDANB171_02283 [Streptomyces sp. enrichment culture]|jgi:hypothetical protein|uniref:DUF6069 family protein n=1 Tax=Streptomyces xiamenensis TaxID=408015 RepID=UPI0037D0CB4B